MYIDQTLRYRLHSPGTFSHKLDLLQTQDPIISANSQKKGFSSQQSEHILLKLGEFLVSRRMKSLIEHTFVQDRIDTGTVNVIFE